MLKGKIIINTQYQHGDNPINLALQKLGATVLSMPLIAIYPIPVPENIKLDIIQNKMYNWLVFTSKNGVDAFFNQLDFNDKTLPFKTAVFGERTALALENKGFSPDIANTGNSAGDLLNDLIPKLQSEDTVLLVLGNLASGLLEETLSKTINVKRLDVYRTVFAETINKKILQRIATNQYDLILFASPSGFKSFKHHAKTLIDLSALKIACLGPTTEEVLLSEGIRPLVVAKPSGKPGLIKGIKRLFAAPELEKTIN